MINPYGPPERNGHGIKDTKKHYRLFKNQALNAVLEGLFID